MNHARTVATGDIFDYDVEAFAVAKYPQKGTCPRSCFASGNHRVGVVPVTSVLDGGAPGDVAIEICLECGAVLAGSGFLIRKQPRSIRAKEVA